MKKDVNQLQLEFGAGTDQGLFMSLTESAKVVGIQPKAQWIPFLIKIGAIYRTAAEVIIPYQKEIDEKRFVVVRTTSRNQAHNVTQTKITQKGLDYYKKKYFEMLHFRIGQTVMIDNTTYGVVIENDKIQHCRVWYMRSDTNKPHASLIEKTRLR